MPGHPTQDRFGAGRATLYAEITDKIIAELEAGRVPWVQPWGTAAVNAQLAMLFQGEILEDHLADFVPEVLLRIELRSVGRQEQQRDIVRNDKIATAVVRSAGENQQDRGALPRSREEAENAARRARADEIGRKVDLPRNSRSRQ